MKQNMEPAKWRECIDPFSLSIPEFEIREILGYPHAGNQVFYIRAARNGIEGYYYLKYAQEEGSSFQNEAAILSRLHSPLYPPVAVLDPKNHRYLITEQLSGRRLSVILAEAGSEDGTPYMYEYGRTLALLHHTKGDFPMAPHRAFHDIPDFSYFSKLQLEPVYHWLTANKPTSMHSCFVHGDFHYANILWEDAHISGIMDFEMAGIGSREFDIAWSLILRPGQRFMKTEAELSAFLAGYQSAGSCDIPKIRYYMVLIYVRFLKLGDSSYEQFVRDWIQLEIQRDPI